MSDACACLDNDAYACWQRRYHLFPHEDVESDGGPCECVCHDEWEAFCAHWCDE